MPAATRRPASACVESHTMPYLRRHLPDAPLTVNAIGIEALRGLLVRLVPRA